ncbi:Polysaccharide deacetylase [Desulfacinum hydrothermale DSM 13146]|uniref:Polysaccharide deacetylase n=1 Tax=Desulfacinum hydrothermale DSM 13146 TaxID=1121390 RepID=A0A1W1X1J6_9BACT|nr:polysaccharide deacetylase family protein [Desulfacinum hydrothermale]SMC17713.1 Polysaccharide deacetylase [Desulfacinum hydrothermale DSM 13146]
MKIQTSRAGTFRPRTCSPLWRKPPEEWRTRLEAACRFSGSGQTPALFFRADDIGAGGRAFRALCDLFRKHGVPLALAVVPAWLSQSRVEQLFQSAPLEEDLWGWHQHGWRHVNWQKTGKKSEFGEQRPLDKQWKDIWQGSHKMKEIFGERTLPVFTPPWNRFSEATLMVLEQLGFKAISTTEPLPRNSKAAKGLINLRIFVDLHTRKGPDPEEDFDKLLRELSAALTRKDPVGIMIHHQRMTSFAFEFLDAFLEIVRQNQPRACRHLSDLI